jgi:hypothetical protein
MKTFREFITELTGKGKLYGIEADNLRSGHFAGSKKRAEKHYAKSHAAKGLNYLSQRRGHVDRFDPEDRPAGRLETMKKVMKRYRDVRDKK